MLSSLQPSLSELARLDASASEWPTDDCEARSMTSRVHEPGVSLDKVLLLAVVVGCGASASV